MQTSMILHHYPNSPFAEKIRAIFGYKGIAWQSVIQPMMMPKPDMQALTGGYRRIPILQIGADIYCDTALMVDVIESMMPSPSLFPNGCEAQARILAQWADSTLFATAMAFNFSPEGAAHFFKDTPPEQAKAFAEDRKAMRGGAARMAPADAKAALTSYLARFEQMLVNSSYLLADTPSLADFSSYHALWFTQKMAPLATIFEAYPALSAWLLRMNALTASGSLLRKDSSIAESFAIADAATPVNVDTGKAQGETVSITAESFGLEASEGKLVALSDSRMVIARETAQSGTVHVHFPRIGFVLKTL